MARRGTLAIALAALLSGGMTLAPAAATAEVVVVTSASSPVLRLTRDQIADIFLGRTHAYPDGRRPVPIDRRDSSALRVEFYLTFTGKSAAQVKAHWSKIIFTGRGKPPHQVSDDADAKHHLAEDPDAIAYIDRTAVDAAVRVVDVR